MAARTPESILRIASVVTGNLMFVALRSRRRLILSNLHHAFPERPPEWHRKIGRESCVRLVETGLLSLAIPYFSQERIYWMIHPSSEVLPVIADVLAAGRSNVFLSPHLAYWELETAFPLVIPQEMPEFGIIFRPLDHPGADEYIKKTRERFGMKLLSRKQGFADALKILRRGGYVGILFDQNAGMQGALTTFLGRVCSTTELPGILGEKFNSRVVVMYPRRISFWRVDLSLAELPAGPESADITIAMNRWLERKLSSDDNVCASWLWLHDRWRNQDIPSKRFRLEAKRDLLSAEMVARHWTSLPRRTRIYIRMPNWLGDVVMALPLLRALRVGRPDAELVLVVRPAFAPWLESIGLAERVIPLPPRGPKYFAEFWKLRDAFPDIWLLFTNSFRGDLEARLAGAPQRFGIVRPGRPRPLLSHSYRVPPEFAEADHHQIELWENFLRAFGLQAEISREPIATRDGSINISSAIGLIPGSENSPEKRWPVAYWRSLIELLPDQRFIIFGTAGDLPLAQQIAAGFDVTRVQNRAGQTDILSFARELAACRLLVTNDTGGMHLANALGVPLIGLFGPTNPVRTGPVFKTWIQILQPPNCDSRGGGRLEDLRVETVAESVRQVLSKGGFPV